MTESGGKTSNWKIILAENFLLTVSGIYLLVSLLCLVFSDLFTSMIAHNLFDFSVYMVTSVPVVTFGIAIFIIISIRKRRLKQAFTLAVLPWLYVGLIVAMHHR